MKKIKVMFILVLSVVLIAGISGCGRNEAQGKTDIRGEVTKTTLNENNEITGILVEGNLEQDTAFDKAMIYLAEKTKVYQGQGNQIAQVSDIKEGIRVEVEFDGPVAESYPVQARAKIIRILD